MLTGCLHPAGQGGITGGQQRPAVRCGQDGAVGGADGVGGGGGGADQGTGLVHPLLIGRGFVTSSDQGKPTTAYATAPTRQTCNTTTAQNATRNGTFFVLCRNRRWPSSAPGHPPSSASKCSVRSGTRRPPPAA